MLLRPIGENAKFTFDPVIETFPCQDRDGDLTDLFRARLKDTSFIILRSSDCLDEIYMSALLQRHAELEPARVKWRDDDDASSPIASTINPAFLRFDDNDIWWLGVGWIPRWGISPIMGKNECPDDVEEFGEQRLNGEDDRDPLLCAEFHGEDNEKEIFVLKLAIHHHG